MQRNNNVWREVAFAKDEEGEPYYWEKWERMLGDGGGENWQARRSKAEVRMMTLRCNLYNLFLLYQRYPRLSLRSSQEGSTRPSDGAAILMGLLCA
jgi:hypothetical protein